MIWDGKERENCGIQFVRKEKNEDDAWIQNWALDDSKFEHFKNFPLQFSKKSEIHFTNLIKHPERGFS
jgi:hypothetical protein